MGVESGSLPSAPPGPLRVHTAAPQRALGGPRGSRLVAGGIPAFMAPGVNEEAFRLRGLVLHSG